MAKPDTLPTLIREVLANWIAPSPAPNDAWCVRCSKNEGRTYVFPAEFVVQHLTKHRDQEPMGYVKVIYSEKKKREPAPS